MEKNVKKNTNIYVYIYVYKNAHTHTYIYTHFAVYLKLTQHCTINQLISVF